MAVNTKIRNKFNVDEELDAPFNFKQLKRAGKYVTKYARELVFALILSIVSILLNLITPLFMQWAVDDYIPNKNIPGLAIMCVTYVAVIAAIMVINRKKALVTNKVGQYIITDMRLDLFAHLQKLPFDYYDSRPHGKILVRVVNYVNSIADFLSNGVVNILIELLSMVAILFFMLALNVPLTLLSLCGLPIFAAFMFSIKGVQRRAHQRRSNKQSNLNAYLQESISGMKVTQAFDRENTNHDIFNTLCEDSRKAWMKAIYVNNFVWPVITLISGGFTLAVYYTVGANIITGVTVGTLLAFINYVGRFWEPITNLGNLFNNLINTSAYLERIFQVLDEPVAIDDKPNAYPLPTMQGRVSFKDVVFEYEEGITVLDHVSFTAEPGESIALVGPTGSGKSTIVSLLARFYDIKSGSITLDGNEIGDVTISSLRSQMGMMLQDTFLFSGTILENIRYGRLDATDEEVIAAAKIVHADDFISKLPDGYNTEVRERGQSLSAGQRQLVSFARTLLADPRILILDEATSSIDTKTELLVQEGLNALLKGRTSFIIAHRLSTIKNCRIMYIMDGKIMESGTHDELMAKKGYYYDLCSAQIEEME